MATDGQWQPQGYQKLARLQAAYPDTAMYRRFSSLNAFVLLSLQARLVNLKFDLEKLCSSDDRSGTGDENCYSTNFKALFASRGSQDGSQGGQLAKLEEVRDVMAQYYDLLVKSAQVARLSRPENHQVRFLDTWLWMQNNMKGFLVSQERLTWDPRYKEDLVCLFPPDSWLNPWIIDFFHRVRYGSSPKTKVEADVELGPIHDIEELLVMRTSRRIWQVLVTLLASMLPVLAILILYFVKRTLYRIAIAIGLTMVAGLFLKIFTAAQTKEIFGATAA
jgi:hypothetical protein